MQSSIKKENLLKSWKEIAAYLDRDARTCRRWEKKFGMPIHRIGEESKSSVFAYKEELDGWLNKIDQNESSSLETPIQKMKWRKIQYILIPIVIIFIIYFSIRNVFQNNKPTNFKINKSDLVILNEKGRELWHYNTGIENLMDENFYKENFQIKLRGNNGSLHMPIMLINDINGDNSPEILFSTKTQSFYGEGELFCFDSKGKRLWKFQAGRELKFGSMRYSADYRIVGIDVCDLYNDGNREILVISSQIPEWPGQVVVLNAKGKIIGEYWNSGYFDDYAFVDLDGDGKKEIILVGINNESKSGCLVVLDSTSIKGCSPQKKEEFRCKDLEPGSEKYYILFPRTDVDLLKFAADGLRETEILKNRILQIKTFQTSIYYEFDYNFHILDIKSSHAFEQMHKEAVLKGEVKSVLNKEYFENLKRGIRYWDVTSWVSHPTMNLHWRTSPKN